MCGTNALCGTCNNPSVVAWIEGRRHHKPPFGDMAQLCAAHVMRTGIFWSKLDNGDHLLTEWPEFKQLFQGAERRKNYGVSIPWLEVSERLVGDLSLLQLPARHVDEQRMLRIISGTLIRVRIMMKSCAVDQHSGLYLIQVPELLLNALDYESQAGLLALSDEVRRVKALPTKTKRQLRYRKNAIKALRRRIVEYARLTFEGAKLAQVAHSLLALLTRESQEFAPAPVRLQLVA
jgi:hypothetical protein